MRSGVGFAEEKKGRKKGKKKKRASYGAKGKSLSAKDLRRLCSGVELKKNANGGQNRREEKISKRKTTCKLSA